MEWDKIWAFNKKVLDPVVARHTTVDKTYNVPVVVKGAVASSHMAAKHPKGTLGSLPNREHKKPYP